MISPHHAVYSATKFFVRGYTEALNIEYKPLGINVCGIYVAYVDTGMVRDAQWKAPSPTSTRARRPSLKARDQPVRLAVPCKVAVAPLADPCVQRRAT